MSLVAAFVAPGADALRAIGAPRALAAALVVAGGLLIFVGLAALVVPLGAWIAGAIAALVALVSGRVDDMVPVIAVTIVVQQVESNVLHPIVMSRALPLHPW